MSSVQPQSDNATHDRHRLLQRVELAAAIAGVLIAVVALVVSRDALSQSKDTAEQNDFQAKYSSITELALGVDQAIADHPRIIKCFMKEACPANLSPEDRDQAYALSFYILDVYQYIHAQMRNLDESPDDGRFVRATDTEAWHSSLG